MVRDNEENDRELAKLQITLADAELRLKEADIEIKRHEIRNRPRFWKTILASPLLIAAVVTGGVAWSTARLTATNVAADRESQLVMDAISTGDPDTAAVHLQIPPRSWAGLRPDEAGHIDLS